MKEKLIQYVNYLQLAKELRREISRDLKPFSVNPIQAVSLIFINNRTVTCGELALHLGTVNPRVTEILKGLRKADLLNEAYEGTTKWLSLTEKGLKTVERINEI